MHEQSPDELRSLRERAYGPEPDIHDDPAALARLRQLEAEALAVRAASVVVNRDAATAVAPDDVAGGLGDGPEAHPGEDSAPSTPPRAAADADGPWSVRAEADADGPWSARAEADADGPWSARAEAEADGPWSGRADPDAGVADAASGHGGARRWTRGRWAWVWAGALVGALVVGAGITYASLQARPGSVAILTPDPDAPWPGNFGNRPAGSEVFEEFAGLTVVLTFQEWSDGAPTPCLFILPAGQDESIMGAGCGAGDFEPTTAVEVTSHSPAELLERFPAGSALQFVLDDGEVIVYSHGP